MIARVLLALDSAGFQKSLARHLSQPEVIIETPPNRAAVWSRLSRETCDLAVISTSLVPRPHQASIRALRELPEAPGIVLLSDNNDPEERASLLAAGCEEVLHAGLSPASLQRVIGALLQRRRERARSGYDAQGRLAEFRLSDFASRSPVMTDFIDMVRRVVSSQSSLLLLGETGVGKEHLARAIHAESPRASGPFIAVNCGALPESLLESELFGHEEGAFTGASRSRRGWFELAHRGTIFLDEIGEMPLHVQVRLLRVLQDQEVQRIGAEASIKVNVRVMAATNRDLLAEVEARRFRRDLYYRLSVVTLSVPPLSQRPEDIRDMALRYVEALRPRVGRCVDSISEDALEALAEYTWPGNVRELINVIERAMLLCSEDEIALADLPDTIRQGRAGAFPLPFVLAEGIGDEGVVPSSAEPLAKAKRKAMDSFERAYLERLLRANDGRIARTAEKAGITSRALYQKMRRHGLQKEDFKPPSKASSSSPKVAP
jgi:DNA-binding NtrC family response regulator